MNRLKTLTCLFSLHRWCDTTNNNNSKKRSVIGTRFISNQVRNMLPPYPMLYILTEKDQNVVFLIFWLSVRMQVIPETRAVHYIWYINIQAFYNHLVYISVDGHLVPWGIISSVARVSALTWNIYYWNFPSNAILVKTNVNFDHA